MVKRIPIARLSLFLVGAWGGLQPHNLEGELRPLLPVPEVRHPCTL